MDPVGILQTQTQNASKTCVRKPSKDLKQYVTQLKYHFQFIIGTCIIVHILQSYLILFLLCTTGYSQCNTN